MTARRLVSSDQGRTGKRQHTRPCSDCPWSPRSLRGWLGTMTAAEWVRAAHGESRIDCHTITNMQSAGAAIYRANVAKTPRFPEILRLPKNRAAAFASPAEFTAHHEKRPTMAKRKKPAPVPPTADEIAAEISKLTGQVGRVRRSSAFGDDHRAAVTAQIKVLETRMLESAIWDTFSPEDDGVHEEPLERRGANVLTAALDARQWMDAGGEAPSDGWEELCR